jgi:predicted N-acetyltransferase YhbS
MKLAIAEGAALSQILDESHRIWADGLSRLAYARYNDAQMRTPWGSQHLRRFVLLDNSGEVISSAKRYDFTAHLDGREIAVVGVGAVFTPEAKRRQGAARQIVECILAAAAEEGAALALLFSEIDPDYYAGMGFIPVPRHEHVIRTKEKPGAPAVLVRAAEERDIPAITALAGAMAAPHRFALKHDDALIRFGVSKKRLLAGFLQPDLLNVEFFIAEEGISAAAFVVLTVTRDDVVLEMCGDRDPAGARVGAILQVLRARTPAEPAGSLACFLPAGWLPPQVDIESSRVVREVMMVRALTSGLLDRPLVEQDVLFWRGDVF